MRIKVCGMTLPEQVVALDEMGVDLAGFIFYPKSPRYVGNKISAERMKQIKGKIAKVGVFVNMPYDDLMRTYIYIRTDDRFSGDGSGNDRYERRAIMEKVGSSTR